MQIWLFLGAASQSEGHCRVFLLLFTGFYKGTDTKNLFSQCLFILRSNESVLVSDFRWHSGSDWVSPC